MSQVAEISIANLVSGLQAALSHSERARIEINTDGLNKLTVGIDGTVCVSLLSVWRNGCFDLDMVRVSDQSSSFVHCEFATTQNALDGLLHETRLAISRS